MGLFGWKRGRKPSEAECCRRAYELLAEDRQLEAVEWLEKAAEWGNATATYNIAVCYYNGVGYGKDYQEARRWAALAAERGYADAAGLIENIDERIRQMHERTAQEWYHAGLYHDESGENYNPELALFCYEQAARLGDVQGQYTAGIWRYGDSQGCVYELAQAKYWLKKAAKAGHARAKEALKRIEG